MEDGTHQLTNLLRIESDRLNEQLLIASEKGNERAAFLLLHQGIIDKDRCQGFLGFSPLHHAAARGHLSILQLLLDFGWPVDIRTDAMETPLHLASFNGQIHVAECLLNRGANINARTKDEDTPIFYAARKGNYRLVRLLIQQECDLNARNCYGDVAEEETQDTRTLNEFAVGNDQAERTLGAQSHQGTSFPRNEAILSQKLRERVMSFLDLKSLGFASQVSYRWHRAADNPSLWKKFGVSRWGLLLHATMGVGSVPQMVMFGATTNTHLRLNLSRTLTQRPYSCDQRIPLSAKESDRPRYRDQLRPQTAYTTGV